MSENYNESELHGCIVCAKIHTVLSVYTHEGALVGCTVTSLGGQIVPDKSQPLVACNSHPAEKIESAHKKWLARRDEVSAEATREK